MHEIAVLDQFVTSATSASRTAGMNALCDRVDQLICWLAPTVEAEAKRSATFRFIKSIVAKCFGPGIECALTGSFALKTYLADADIDVTILLPDGQDTSEEVWYSKLMRALFESINNQRFQDSGFTVRSVTLINAEVKLVKCVVNNLKLDISARQRNAVQALKFFQQVNGRIGHNNLFKRSLILIKAWCSFEGAKYASSGPVCSAATGGLCTHALNTLVAFIFNVYHISNPFIALVIFFRHYVTFDWERYYLSLDGALPLSSVGTSRVRQKYHSPTKFSSPRAPNPLPVSVVRVMNVQDPIDDANNVTRGVSTAGLSRWKKALIGGRRDLVTVARRCLGGGDVASMVSLCDVFFKTCWQRYGMGDGWRPDILMHPLQKWTPKRLAPQLADLGAMLPDAAFEDRSEGAQEMQESKTDQACKQTTETTSEAETTPSKVPAPSKVPSQQIDAEVQTSLPCKPDIPPQHWRKILPMLCVMPGFLLGLIFAVFVNPTLVCNGTGTETEQVNAAFISNSICLPESDKILDVLPAIVPRATEPETITSSKLSRIPPVNIQALGSVVASVLEGVVANVSQTVVNGMSNASINEVAMRSVTDALEIVVADVTDTLRSVGSDAEVRNFATAVGDTLAAVVTNTTDANDIQEVLTAVVVDAFMAAVSDAIAPPPTDIPPPDDCAYDRLDNRSVPPPTISIWVMPGQKISFSMDGSRINSTEPDKNACLSHSACDGTSYRWLKTGDSPESDDYSVVRTINVSTDAIVVGDSPGTYTQLALCRNFAGAAVDTVMARVAIEKVSVPEFRNNVTLLRVRPGDAVVFDLRDQVGDFFGPVKYQWEKNGQPVSWAVSRTLEVKKFDPDLHGYGTYTCLVITPTGVYRWEELNIVH